MGALLLHRRGDIDLRTLLRKRAPANGGSAEPVTETPSLEAPAMASRGKRKKKKRSSQQVLHQATAHMDQGGADVEQGRQEHVDEQ